MAIFKMPEEDTFRLSLQFLEIIEYVLCECETWVIQVSRKFPSPVEIRNTYPWKVLSILGGLTYTDKHGRES